MAGAAMAQAFSMGAAYAGWTSESTKANTHKMEDKQWIIFLGQRGIPLPNKMGRTTLVDLSIIPNY
jgi:hypothetical protein